MKRFIPGLVLCCLFFIPGLASAQGQGWSVLSGETVGSGRTVFHGQVGFPGLSATLLHGNSDKVDLGGRFSFNYGQEGIVDAINPGLKLQGLMRINLAKSGKVNVGLALEPGVLFYFYGGGTDIGMAIPLKLAVGIPASSALMINVGMDLPLWIRFNRGSTVVIPILFGGGLEYAIDQSLMATFNLRMGPSIATAGGGTSFTLESLIGIAVKL